MKFTLFAALVAATAVNGISLDSFDGQYLSQSLSEDDYDPAMLANIASEVETNTDLEADADVDADADADAEAEASVDAEADDNQTHIAVTTSQNQQVTIDMPIEEAKRVTVKPNALVAEDLDFAKGAAEAGIKKATD